MRRLFYPLYYAAKRAQMCRFLCVLFPLSYLHFVLFRKNNFEKNIPQKRAKYAEQNAEQIEFDVQKALVLQGKADILPYRGGMRSNGITAARVHLGDPPEQWFESYSFYPKHGYAEYEPRYMRKKL